jgi:arsenate reductase
MVATDTVRIEFICVHNAGRSQMAAAYAEREQAERGLGDIVEVHSAGTDPADEIERTAAESEDGPESVTARVSSALRNALSF